MDTSIFTLALQPLLFLYFSSQAHNAEGQGFRLRGVTYSDGDTVLLTVGDIGDNQQQGLQCLTTQSNCCGLTPDGIIVKDQRRGEFYYPNGTQVPRESDAGSDGLFRGRNYQFITLQQLSTAITDPPTGRYRCDIPDRDGNSHNMFINIALLSTSITPIGVNTAGETYKLSCVAQSTAVTRPSFSWFGPPNGVSLPTDNSDIRRVSDVMSNGSTHTSILQFDPLQSSHEGDYTCQVTVQVVNDTVSRTSTFEVNVESPIYVTTTQQLTTRVTGPTTEDNTVGDRSSGLGIIEILVIVFVPLVVVILPVIVTVMVCILKRRSSARNKSDIDGGDQLQYNLAPNISKFDLTTNVAYGGPTQRHSTITSSDMYMYADVRRH